MLNSYFIAVHQSSQYVVKRDVSAKKAITEIPTKTVREIHARSPIWYSLKKKKCTQRPQKIIKVNDLTLLPLDKKTVFTKSQPVALIHITIKVYNQDMSAWMKGLQHDANHCQCRNARIEKASNTSVDLGHRCLLMSTDRNSTMDSEVYMATVLWKSLCPFLNFSFRMFVTLPCFMSSNKF